MRNKLIADLCKKRNQMRIVPLFGILLLSLLAQGQAGVTLSFGANTVTADGITHGKAAVFFATGLVPDDEQQRIVRWRKIVSDDDGDGRVSLALDGGVTRSTIWAVVDLTDGRFAIGSPPGFYPRFTRIPNAAFRHSGGSAAVDLFGFDHPVLDLLYVHPGLGAWTWNAVDGRSLDRDRPNGVTLIAAGDGTPLGDTRGKRDEFSPGGILVAIDWYHMEVLAIRLDAAILGGAR
jgi:hypothetical protein